MSEPEAVRQLAEAYLARADEALRAARSLHEGQLWRDSISRSYYVMFYSEGESQTHLEHAEHFVQESRILLYRLLNELDTPSTPES